MINLVNGKENCKGKNAFSAGLTNLVVFDIYQINH
jgi:hypothetical protein